jgi:lipase maturation factor 1
MARMLHAEAVKGRAQWLFAPAATSPGVLWPRWIFLRALGLVFLSAFDSLAYQIHGLIGHEGILPADKYLALVTRAMPGLARLWYAPTLLWLGSGDSALTLLVVLGTVASALLILNVWPRGSIAVAWLAFLSFIGAAQDFASYQSDGMLLEAGFISFFFAPSGWLPGLGSEHPPSRASLFLLKWEWFRIYFESGVVKLASGDPSWRDMTAMDHYYENGPLPTWLGWYVQHFGHAFHAATAIATLIIELAVCWLGFFPRRVRLGCFFIVTVLQIGIIATANYAFLNYIVLALGVLLLDDGWIEAMRRFFDHAPQHPDPDPDPATSTSTSTSTSKLLLSAIPLSLVFYATLVTFLFRGAPPPLRWLFWPAEAIEPLRIANRYGLFAVMTPARYEIELQGSADGRTWQPYAFRYKPQDLDEPPGLYAPYQPRFEWNLWFASLGSWKNYPFVVRAEARLLEGSPSVLSLFAKNPFENAPPRFVRAVIAQYHFTDSETQRTTGAWWTRDRPALYCPELTRGSDGSIQMLGGGPEMEGDEEGP